MEECYQGEEPAGRTLGCSMCPSLPILSPYYSVEGDEGTAIHLGPTSTPWIPGVTW